jgi:hypothetical protein
MGYFQDQQRLQQMEYFHEYTIMQIGSSRGTVGYLQKQQAAHAYTDGTISVATQTPADRILQRAADTYVDRILRYTSAGGIILGAAKASANTVGLQEKHMLIQTVSFKARTGFCGCETSSSSARLCRWETFRSNTGSSRQDFSRNST